MAFNRALAFETERRDLPLATVQRGVRAVLRSRQHGFYLVATLGREVVGQLMVTFEWSDWRNGCFWWLQSVYVAPAHRRCGVFRALFAELQRRARKRPDVCGLRLYVEHRNRRAAATYRQLGLKKTGYEVMEIDDVLGHEHAPGGSNDRRPPTSHRRKRRASRGT